MASYDDIKAAAAQLRGETTTTAPTRRLAEIVIALCDRQAELEARHRADMQRVEALHRQLRR